MWGGRPRQVLSGVVVVWSTHRGGLIPPVYTERSDKTLGGLEFACNEAVLSRGRDLVSTPAVLVTGMCYEY